MAHGLEPHVEWQQLSELYRAMSDEEVLGLSASLDDLTDTARDVLRSELKIRRLQLAGSSAPVSAPPEAMRSVERANDLRSGGLTTFHDAFDAGRACECLEREGIGFEMRDVSAPSSGLRTFDGGPPVALQLFVEGADRQRAMTILRKSMGLFPVQEVEVADEPMDDGTLSTLGDFGRHEDAEGWARILEDAGFWHRIVPNPGGTEENEDCYSLEVKEVDLVRAGEVLEKAMELSE